MFYKIEEAMTKNNIVSHGVAEGDLKLGRYVSLRNESYVRSELND